MTDTEINTGLIRSRNRGEVDRSKPNPESIIAKLYTQRQYIHIGCSKLSPYLVTMIVKGSYIKSKRNANVVMRRRKKTRRSTTKEYLGQRYVPNFKCMISPQRCGNGLRFGNLLSRMYWQDCRRMLRWLCYCSNVNGILSIAYSVVCVKRCRNGGDGVKMERLDVLMKVRNMGQQYGGDWGLQNVDKANFSTCLLWHCIVFSDRAKTPYLTWFGAIGGLHAWNS